VDGRVLDADWRDSETGEKAVQLVA